MTLRAVARRSACLAAAVVLATASIPWIGVGQAAAAPILTVNSLGDVVDLVPGDGSCDTGNLVGPDPECTLRAAIQEANLGPADEIVLPAGTYTLTIAGTGENDAATGDLDILADVTITGAGLATTFVQAGTNPTNGIDRVFEVRPTATVTMSDLTIRFGAAPGNEGGAVRNEEATLTIVDAVVSDSSAQHGGGIYSKHSAANLTLTRVTVRDNTADEGGGLSSKDGSITLTDVIVDSNVAGKKGGGLESDKGTVTITRALFFGNSVTNDDGGGAHLHDSTDTLTDVTFDSNVAGRRGGGINKDNGILTIDGATFTNNSALGEDGGGLNVRGGADATITNVTFSGNSAVQRGGGAHGESDLTIYSSTLTGNSATTEGGGVHRQSGTLTIKNSIVAANPTGGNCSGTITSAGYNLEDTAVCPFTQPGDQQNADPLLGPLTDNGGPTLTHALAAGSPAMEAGTSLGVGVPGVDQRGVARPQDGDNDTFAIIDIGAYEHQFAVPNNPPTDISLVPSDVDENVPVGTVVGTLTTTDPDPADTHTYDLVIGVGDTHNGLFTIVGDELRTDAALDFETLGASLSIRVETTDSGVGNLTYQEAMTVTLNDVNDPPVLAAIGDQSGDEGSLITFDAEATDPDVPAQTLSFAVDDSAPGHSLPAGYGFDPVSGVFTWTPTESQGGESHTFVVVVSDDGAPVESDSETITVTADETNDPPVLAAIGDWSGGEGSLITFDAEATDPDVPAQSLSFGVDDSAPGHSLPAGYGFDPVSGVFTWTPTESQGGESHTFVVVVSDDGVPVESDSETITVTADETNDPPVLAAIGDLSGDEGSLITFDAEATDPDVPAQSLSFGVDDSAPGHSLPAGYGFDPVSGVFTWTPTESQGGESHTFVVVVSDDGVPVESDSETVTVTADETNQPPVVTNPSDQTDSEGVPIVPVAIPATDSDLPAQGLSWSALGLPPGLSIDPLLGIVSGTPPIGSAGSYPVSVTVTDGVDPTVVAFTWTIVANQPPVTDPISDQAPDEGDTVSLTATATDPEGDDLTWTKDSGPGAVTEGGDYTWTTTEADGPGVYSVTLRVTDDGVPNLSDTVTFTVTVGEVDAPPVASPIADQSVTEGGVVTVAASASDPDLPATPLTWSLISGPGFVAPGGTYTWLPGEADGPGVYAVTLQVSDGLATDTVTFTVTVAEQNQPPVPTVLGTEVVTAGNTVSVVATATDVDLPVNTLTWTLVDGPGAVTVSGAYAWTTSVDTVPGSYAVSLAVFDGTDSSSVSFTVVVLESPLVNQPPVAVTDTLVVVPGRSGSVDPVANDTDPEGDTLSLVLVDTPPTGILIVDGQTVTFTAPDDFEGPIEVGYVVGDANGATTTGTIRIEADPTNHPPQGFPDVVIADDYRVLAIAVLANDVDVDGDQLHIVSVEAPADGRAEVTDGVTISYYPEIGWVGSESFAYVVADSAGNQDTVLVVVTINAAAAEEAAERSDVLGTRVVSFRNPAADVVPVPFEATLGGSVSLMTDAFFQSLGAMSLPLVFLILGLLMVFAFGGFSEVPMLVAATRRRLWSIVLHHREVLYKVYAEPDESSAVIYSYEPTAGGIRSTDKAFTQRGRTWMPIDSPNGIGYVDATHLAETVAFEDFKEDSKPVQLVRQLTKVLDEGDDLTTLISQRGLVVAIGGRVHEIPIDAVQGLRGNLDADAPSIEHQFESLVAEPLRRALLDNPTISPQTKHSQTALISTELWNFPYLAIHAPGQPSWLVHFEYVHGRPSIVGFALDE